MDTILSVGAHGECPARLIALLQAAGYTVPTTGPSDTLTPEVMAAVAEAENDLDVQSSETLVIASAGAPDVTVKGRFVTQATWDALRAAAAQRTGLVTPTEAHAINEIGTARVEAETAPAAPEGVTTGEQAAAAEAASRAAEQTPPPADIEQTSLANAEQTPPADVEPSASAEQTLNAGVEQTPNAAAEQTPPATPEGVTAGEQAAAAEAAAKHAETQAAAATPAPTAEGDA